MRTLTVGAVLSQTGIYALQGRQALQGLRLWVEDTNAQGGLVLPELGRPTPLQLIVYDDNSRRSQVEQHIAQLIQHDRVDFLIGPYSSGLTYAAAVVAEAHQKLLWNHGGSSDRIMRQGFRWLVNLPTPASRYFAGLFSCLRARMSAGDRIAIVHRPRGTFALEVAAGTRHAAESSSLLVLPPFSYPEAPSQLQSLVADLAAVSPAAIVGVGRYEDDVALVRALAQRKFDPKALALVAAPMQAFYKDIGGRAEGCIGPSQWEPSVIEAPEVGPTCATFVDRFRQRFAETPDYPSAQAYAAGLIMQRCVAVAGTLQDAALQRAAWGLTCRTLYGRFQLQPETSVQVGHEMLLVQWQTGEKRIISPASLAQAPPVYPKPPAG